ncbi:MAG: helix-turn-helix domain-containing protein [Lachnospiraceae bacterium]
MGEKKPKYQTIVEDENCLAARISDVFGDGMMTFYKILPGVSVIYNDFHMASCESDFKPDYDMLCIDHCREGRIEQEVEKGVYTYFEAGDLKVDRRIHHIGHMEMPTKHFHGISIAFDMKQAIKSLPEAMNGFPVDLYSIQHKYCDDKHPFVISGEPSIEHIFSELYAIPLEIKNYYLRVKVFELLLFLDALELSPGTREERPYFYKTQVEKIKTIHKLLTENITEHYTLKDLARRFDIPLTTMKSCFKSIYGNSIFAYMRNYRMNHAANLLREQKDLSIAQIAGMVGYDSPGKFSTAFKDIIGDTPLVYRKFPGQAVNFWPDGEDKKEK